MNKERVVVAMSGGVDSSVAAALLKEQGYEVVGITMCFSAVGGSASGGNLADIMRRKPACCGIKAIEDARRVAHKLGIRHYVLNMQKSLEKWVIRDFLKEYLRGRTPNPCVRCNQFLKFDILLKKALQLDAKFLATGHYARIVRSARFQVQCFLLKKAKDKTKDQSYFLYRLNQSQLKHILFPLGEYTKNEVRQLARKLDLPVAEKLASQEICFLPSDNYREFLKARVNTGIKPGFIVDKEGKILGQHKGIAFYTIGQRQGLGIARGYPIYIAEINSRNDRITIGNKNEVCKREFLIKEPHFILRAIQKKVAARIKIRYNHKEAWAQIMPAGKGLRVCFKKPQFAITPGQSAVFYDKDVVLGGGIIEKVLG
jgi:tRNA-specific 2-thiouridylase